jgi:hypothetical protein
MERRKFLYYILGAAAINVPSLSCRDRNVLSNRTLLLPRLLSRLTDEETVRQIGKTYRKQVKAEDDQDTLADRLLEEKSGKTVSQTADASFIRTFLEDKIRQDFESDRIIVLRGWILSLTEARQCALYSFSSP